MECSNVCPPSAPVSVRVGGIDTVLVCTQIGFQPGDFASYLCGYWKRNLEWRELGGPFTFLRTSNTVVHVCQSTCPVSCFLCELFCVDVRDRLKSRPCLPLSPMSGLSLFLVLLH